MNKPQLTLISEPVKAMEGSFDGTAMERGEPGLPLLFLWRNATYRVKAELRHWRSTRPCRSGSAEKYAGKHYHEVITETGETMVLYRERSGSKTDSWILYTIQKAPQ